MTAEIYSILNIVSRSPLVTFSSAIVDNKRSVLSEVAKQCPEVFDVRTGLHLVHYSWSIEAAGDLAAIRAGLTSAQETLPGHTIVPLAANEGELQFLKNTGFRAVMGNGLIFCDERIWRPTMPHGSLFDAAYNGRLDPYKRHELAAGIDSLLLIYDWSLSASTSDRLEYTKKMLPTAFFANHELNGGNFYPLSKEKICQLYGLSEVGLCLSAEEGVMRASMEYLLCGLPVVTTKSQGGRDRYLSVEYSSMVSDDPDEVARAVQLLKNKNFDREKIRSAVLENLKFDRSHLLDDMDRLAKTDKISDWRRLSFENFLFSKDFELESTLVKKINETARDKLTI